MYEELLEEHSQLVSDLGQMRRQILTTPIGAYFVANGTVVKQAPANSARALAWFEAMTQYAQSLLHARSNPRLHDVLQTHILARSDGEAVVAIGYWRTVETAGD